MAEEHALSVKVEADSDRSGRYRWIILKSGRLFERSDVTFATIREATEEAAKILERRTRPEKPYKPRRPTVPKRSPSPGNG
jgi:hypothetical protein